MAGVKVGALDLRLVAPPAMQSQADELTDRAGSDFVPAVLRNLEARLRTAYGRDAVVQINRIQIRCRMQTADLSDVACAEQVGQDIAAQILRQVERERGGGARPSADASVQVFRDPAHRRAVALLAAAEGRKGPADTKQSIERLRTETRRQGPRFVRDTLVRCGEIGGLETVLDRIGPAALDELASVLAEDPSEVVATAVAQALARAGKPSGRQGPARRARRRRTSPEAKPRKPAARPAVEPDPPPDPAPDQPKPAAETPVPVRPAGPASTPGAVPPAGPPAPPQESDRTEAAPASASHDDQASAETTPEKEPEVLPATEPYPEGAALPEEPPDEDEPEDYPAYASAWCGLLYLLNISKRIELPERLWQVGIDEGAALAAMMARLAGTDADPATQVLAKTFPAATQPPEPLAQWARDELCAGGLADADRLVARRTDGDRLRDRIAALEAWFREEPDSTIFDLPAWGAALHLGLAESLLDETIEPGTVEERFARPGRIEVGPTEILVIQPMEAIDLAVRSAALDRDPGHLPWLDKRLLFVFEGAEEGDE